MTQRREPLLAWPGWEHLCYFAFLGLVQTFWFGLIYGGSDFLTARRALRFRIYLEAERQLPFIPSAIVIYMSIYVLFWAAPFILRTRRELRALAMTLALVTLCGGICFLLFPTELDFPVPQDLGFCAELFRFADWLNLDYNQVPSLHVALSVVCVAAFSTSRGVEIASVLLWLWALAVGVSAVLSFQHHVFDVLTGFCLGVVGARLVYRRLRTPASELET